MIWLLPWDSHHGVRHWPWVTWALMAANVVVFMLMPGDPGQLEAFFRQYGLIAGDWRWYQLVTGAFLHGDLFHLVGNLFFLWVFGDNVEDALGPIGFALLYALGGLAGDLLWIQANDTLVPTIGASGCIAAVAGAYGALFFRHSIDLKVVVLVIPVYTLHLRAFWVLLLYFGVDTWRTLEGKGYFGDAQSGVNFVSHGAGFLFGLALGLAGLAHGVMRRYEQIPGGHAWWGYWPRSLEEQARLAALRARQLERLRDQARRS